MYIREIEGTGLWRWWAIHKATDSPKDSRVWMGGKYVESRNLAACGLPCPSAGANSAVSG
jgi:hypothetical protein